MAIVIRKAHEGSVQFVTLCIHSNSTAKSLKILFDSATLMVAEAEEEEREREEEDDEEDDDDSENWRCGRR